MMRSTKVLISALTLTLALLQAASGYKLSGRYPVPGNGGFDYITLDESSRRLYLSHGTQVDVVDADTGKLAGTILDTPGVHGIAIAEPYNRGFTTNGGENKALMFDRATLKPLGKIDVGRGPDGIYYEPRTKRIFTNNHGSHDITAIDAQTGTVVGTVKIDGDGEQAVLADGRIYVNSEDKNEVVVFDPGTLAVIRRMPIDGASTPTGLAYDSKNKRLFIACREQPTMIVMDAESGKTIAKLPIGSGADWAHFDASSKRVFVSTSEGVLNVFHQKSANEYDQAESVKTQPGARTMAFDAKTKKIFLPSVEYDMIPATTPGKQPRRSVRPGSFAVLVVSQ